jgi:putative inorganic carbon (HCO3(-)) transporter
VGLFLCAVRTGLRQRLGEGPLALPALAAVAIFLGLAVQGLTDTIFFRPEVQLVALFALATVAAAGSAGAPAATGEAGAAAGD